ncbi:MAG TPA: hypothetical protein PK413_21535, partial [Thermoanaerobaculia bacterium]|nr:hypothetical protein [Thermoanaerobaculia bacterium]
MAQGMQPFYYLARRYLEARDLVALSQASRATHYWVTRSGAYDVAQRPSMLAERPSVAAPENIARLAAQAFQNFQRFLRRAYAITTIPPSPVPGEAEATAARSTLAGQRAWAVVVLPTATTYSTNYLMGAESVGGGNQLMRSGTGTGLTLYNGPAEYQRHRHEHGELRMARRRYAQRRVAEQQANPIAVNMAYCIFCAVHLASLDERLVHPFHTGQLRWYRFSEWVMFFASQRERLWGAEVEAAYSALSGGEREIPEGKARSRTVAQLLRWASWVLSLPVLLFACAPFFSSAWRDLLARRVSMDLP